MIALVVFYLTVIILFYTQMMGAIWFTSLSFVLLCAMILLEFKKKNRVTLFIIWLTAFIYMIQSEMILLSHESIVTFEDIKAFSFLSFGNLMFIVGYVCNRKKYNTSIVYEFSVASPKSLLLIVAGLYVFFVYFRIIDVFRIFYMGRDQGDSLGGGSVLETFTLAIGYMLPSLIGFYAIRFFPSKKWLSLFFVIPLFVIGALLGARYKLLFMLIPYLAVMDVLSPKKISKKNLIYIAVIGTFLVSLSTIIKFTRSHGFADADLTSINERRDTNNDFLYKIAIEMSPENIVKMTKYGNRYFDNEGHSYLYGLNSSFVLYIWIPRSIWKNKPTPLDYWMIRKYENVSDAASTASGFIGDFRADFGYFSFLIILLIGAQLKRLDKFIHNLSFSSDNNLQKVLIGFCFAWVFFFVRSPLTSTNSFIIAMVFLYIIIKTCTKKSYVH